MPKNQHCLLPTLSVASSSAQAYALELIGLQGASQIWAHGKVIFLIVFFFFSEINRNGKKVLLSTIMVVFSEQNITAYVYKDHAWFSIPEVLILTNLWSSNSFVNSLAKKGICTFHLTLRLGKCPFMTPVYIYLYFFFEAHFKDFCYLDFTLIML